MAVPITMPWTDTPTFLLVDPAKQEVRYVLAVTFQVRRRAAPPQTMALSSADWELCMLRFLYIFEVELDVWIPLPRTLAWFEVWRASRPPAIHDMVGASFLVWRECYAQMKPWNAGWGAWLKKRGHQREGFKLVHHSWEVEDGKEFKVMWLNPSKNPTSTPYDQLSVRETSATARRLSKRMNAIQLPETDPMDVEQRAAEEPPTSGSVPPTPATARTLPMVTPTSAPPAPPPPFATGFDISHLHATGSFGANALARVENEKAMHALMMAASKGPSAHQSAPSNVTAVRLGTQTWVHLRKSLVEDSEASSSSLLNRARLVRFVSPPRRLPTHHVAPHPAVCPPTTYINTTRRTAPQLRNG